LLLERSKVCAKNSDQRRIAVGLTRPDLGIIIDRALNPVTRAHQGTPDGSISGRTNAFGATPQSK